MRRDIATEIDSELCIGCGECVRVCPTSAISMVDGIAVVTGDTSLGCGHCAAVCPSDAVTVLFEDRDALRLETVPTTEEHIPPGQFDTAQLVRLMRSRRSCRNYDSTPVARGVLEDLVRIATTAPSGTNSQRWTFTILPDRAAVLSLAEEVKTFFETLNRRAANPGLRLLARLFAGDALGRYHREHAETVQEGLEAWEEEGRDLLFHGSTAAILVGCSPGASCPAEDALLATQNMILAAHAMGLGTCLIGFVVSAIQHEPHIRKTLGIPSDENIYSVVAIGYPDESYVKPTGRRKVEPRYYLGGQP